VPVRAVDLDRKSRITVERHETKVVSARRLQKQRPLPRKAVMSSWADEDSLCSTVTAHDKRKAPRPKQFVSDRGLQKQRPEAESR
jgi:hypothetical protein